MELTKLISKTKFDLLSKKYVARTGLSVVMVDLTGESVYALDGCGLCEKLLAKENTILQKNCRLKMMMAVEEAYRWGEGYITSCPAGLIMFAVPLVIEKKLIGGLLSGFAIFPEMGEDFMEEIQENLREFFHPGNEIDVNSIEVKVFSLDKVRDHVSYLWELTRKFHINDIVFLQNRREKYIQQYKIANFLEELKRSSPNIARKILDKEDEIIQKVKLGDKSGAREILNEFLGSIFFESGMNFEIIKVRIVELVVIISRAAIEAGVEAHELLGLNFSSLTELNRSTDIDELLFKLSEILENFITKVSSSKEKKRKTRIRNILDHIEQNFTKGVTAAEVARIGGLSVSRALHLIKEETGQSLSDYIKRLRIDYGKYLLLNTDVRLADVAIEAGFYDQSHFTKTFRKIEKTTPSSFRRKYRKEKW